MILDDPYLSWKCAKNMTHEVEVQMEVGERQVWRCFEGKDLFHNMCV